MIRMQGSTNGFFFSETLIGNEDIAKMAVVPLPSGASYAVRRRAGRRIAKSRKAPGFWRLKALKQ